MNVEDPMACFAVARERSLARLADATLDKAPAGGPDRAALPLINALNRRQSYVTTSTCAGRCVIYAVPSACSGKREGRWLFSSHDGIEMEGAFIVLS